MKIGMFTNYYIPSKGGVETSVMNLCQGLESVGHKTFVFAPEYPNWEDKEKNIFRYKSFSFYYGGYFYVIPIPFLSKAESVIKSLGLDIIHSHQPYSLGNEALGFSKNLDVPLVFTYHIKYEDYSHYIPFVPSSISKKYIRKITTKYSNKCDVVIAPSSAIKNLLEDQGVEADVDIIPSGINVGRFRKDAGKRNEIRKKYGLKSEDIVLITASRITKEKNIGFLIESFSVVNSVVKKSGKNIKLLIVGDGAERNKLEGKVKDLNLEKEIFFTGLVSRDEIVNLYQASDVFVFASLTETQGLVAVEAMASGLPVIAIKASGIEDIVKSGEDGILTGNSIGEFSESVLKIARDENLRKELSVKAKINSGEFSIELWIEKMVKLYRSLVG
jgi:glycosyltransferase involved in cell wall biosynthesis